MEYRTKLRLALLAALAAVSPLGGCADAPAQGEEASSAGPVGKLGLALEVAPDVVLTAIDYEITGVGFTLTGTLQVPGSSSTFSAVIANIPVGVGHQLRLSSRAEGDAGISCGGSAEFGVVQGQTTQVNVTLLCDAPDNSGATSVNGSFNVCPLVSSSSATPVVQQVGGTIQLGLTARDTDHGPSALSYAWSSASGSFAAANGATPIFTCAQPGPALIQYTVTDGNCSKTGTLSATCTLPTIRINEVESNGGTPGDWVELYNPGTTPVDLSGWMFKDDDNGRTFRIATGSIIAAGGYFLVEEAQFGFGLGGADMARLYGPDGVTLVDSYSWTAHATSTYGRCPNGAGDFVQTPSSKGSANVCGGADAGTDGGVDASVDAGTDGGGASSTVVINEVESNGGTPGDWVELYNPTTAPVDLSGWMFKDNDDGRTFRIATGSVITPGGYFLVEEAQFGFGLGGPDSARLYAADGTTLVDSYSWATHATSTYGRCPNGSGAFQQTTSSKGVANVCTPLPDGDAGVDGGVDGGQAALPWPGGNDVFEVDALNAFASNLSGLAYQKQPGAAPATLWAVQNDPSKLFRLQENNGLWTSFPGDGWSDGKTLFYPNGSGRPDTEGVTVAGSYLYVATERDNALNTVSRLSILQLDPAGAGTTLTALREWNVTSDLPSVGANLGLEAIAFVADTELAARAFREGNGQPYNPARFAQNGGGVFLVGVEGTGNIHVYALDHAAGAYARLATFASGMPGVMDLQYDPDTHYLWAYGDDTAGNHAVLFEIEQNSASPSYGQFVQRSVFERPSGLPPVNNEGIAFAPESECSGGFRSFFWSDDNATGGHSLRRGSLRCGRTY